MLHCHEVFTTGCPTTVALAIEIARGRVHKIVDIRRFTTYVVNANHFIMAVTGVSVSAWVRLTDADRPLNDSDLARIQSVYPILLLKLDTTAAYFPYCIKRSVSLYVRWSSSMEQIKARKMSGWWTYWNDAATLTCARFSIAFGWRIRAIWPTFFNTEVRLYGFVGTGSSYGCRNIVLTPKFLISGHLASKFIVLFKIGLMPPFHIDPRSLYRFWELVPLYYVYIDRIAIVLHCHSYCIAGSGFRIGSHCRHILLCIGLVSQWPCRSLVHCLPRIVVYLPR